MEGWRSFALAWEGIGRHDIPICEHGGWVVSSSAVFGVVWVTIWRGDQGLDMTDLRR